MKNRLTVGAFTCLLAICGTVGAKTVALWTMNDPSSYNSPNETLRCAIDPRNDLTVYSTATYPALDIGWNLPPSPDATEGLLQSAVGRTFTKTSGNQAYLRTASLPLTYALSPTNSFTIEGWIKPSALPPEGTEGSYKILFYAIGASGNQYGGYWIALHNKTGKDTSSVHFEIQLGNAGSYLLDGSQLSDAEIEALTGSWNHFALVYDNTDASWNWYWNGTARGSYTKRFSKVSQSAAYQYGIYIGKHSSNSSRTMNGGYAYWRVSDEALSPSQFLNYDPDGNGGTTVPADDAVGGDRTVAYWKMNCVDGKLDVRDYVGQAHLAALNRRNTGCTPAAYMMLPSEDCPFEANPPNPTVTYPSGNHGSFMAVPTKLNYVVVTNNSIGAMLDVTNSFTVEGWFKPQRRAGTEVSSQGWMFGIYPNTSTRGWMIGMERPYGSDRRILRLHAANYNGTRTYLHSTASFSHYTFCDVTDWGEEWRHVALTYDRTGGEAGLGEWKLYMNGVLAGTVTNNTAVTEATKTSSNFYIGGNINGSFGGLYDSIRVSQGVLSPKQFLCYDGEDAEAATGVIATWPLNITAGTGYGGANIEGGYNLFGRETDFPEGYYLTKGSDLTPLANISNPESSQSFDGDAATASTNIGSVAFCAGDRHDMGWLATFDNSVISTLKGEDGWTLEGYVRYDTTNGEIPYGCFGCLFGMLRGVKPTESSQNNVVHLMAVYRGKAGFDNFWLYQQIDAFGTKAADGNLRTLKFTNNAWHHIAVCHSYWTDDGGETPVRMSRMAYFLNGTFVTNIDTVAKTTENFTGLVFGSNDNGSRGFPGMVSNFRLSRGVLAPSEFLNASAAVPEAPAAEKGALAYWPVDAASDEGAVDAEVRDGTGGYALWNQSQDAVTGSVLRARRSVPNDGVPFDRANAGSAALSDGGYAMADYLGAKLDVDSPWTVEGWFLRGHGEAAKRVLAGSRDSTGNWGWRLYVDDTGATPVFSLRVTPYMCTPMVEGVFPNASGMSVDWTDWVHVALTFDPFDGKGTWTLLVNGRTYGKLENAWRNMTMKCQANYFGLGALSGAYEASFAGNVDMWRASRGALDVKDLLYRPQSMTMIIFR